LKISNHKLCQFIVKKFIKGNINWPREIKIAQKLVKRFNSFEFWYNLRELGSPPPSLAWFLKSEGKAFILKEYEEFNLNLNQELINLNKNKIGEDKKVCQKPKTLVEFIRYGKKT
jgi:hypothetical protein